MVIIYSPYIPVWLFSSILQSALVALFNAVTGRSLKLQQDSIKFRYPDSIWLEQNLLEFYIERNRSFVTQINKILSWTLMSAPRRATADSSVKNKIQSPEESFGSQLLLLHGKEQPSHSSKCLHVPQKKVIWVWKSKWWQIFQLTI